jgi:hypothetical protein
MDTCLRQLTPRLSLTYVDYLPDKEANVAQIQDVIQRD